MKAIINVRLWTLILFTALFINTIPAQSLEADIDKILSERYKTNESGATALVAKNGKILYRKAFGMANLELGVLMKPENVFEIGSITKQFTAVAILMLMEEGKLSLNDDITKFIPDYPSLGKSITIHHLLTHTSGIKSYTGMPGLRKLAKNEMSPSELIDHFKNEPMDFDPGEEYKYNNSGYILLGYIIEKVSEQSYEDFVENNIFKKIGMTASYYGSKTTIIPNRASGYQRNNDVYENADYIDMSLPYAAGSIMASIDDMLKWQQAIKNNVLIKSETLKLAFTDYTLNNGEKIGYGYGWGFDEVNGTPSIEHGGGIFGYTTQGIYVPGNEVYVIVLTNCGCKSPGSVATRIAAVALGNPYPSPDQAIVLSSEQLEKWAGAYKFEGDIVRNISVEDGVMYSQREGSSKFKILPKSMDEFFFEDGLISYKFSMKNGKKAVSMKNRGKEQKGIETNHTPLAEKESVTLDVEILTQYAGKYELQPGFVITVTPRDNQIFAQATGQPEFELFAEDETNFFLKVVPAKIVFEKDENGKVNGLTLYQGGREMPGKKIE